MAAAMWVKICGTTSLEDAQLAIDAGADALGFVFAPSPRQVTAEQVAAITRHLPPEVERFGVFVNPSLDEAVAAVEQAGLTGVQLHGSADPDLPARLRARLAPSHAGHVSVIGVVHFEPHQSLKDFSATLAAAHRACDAVLIDSRTATAEGGTGVPFDWEGAQHALAEGGKPARMIVAGGLNADNVQQAIALLQPWGVDVVSGVEAAPGRKDGAKVRAFVQAAQCGSGFIAAGRP
jgi:phosphoribosylanthranilate isomerase